jgi:hypothetical protein
VQHRRQKAGLVAHGYVTRQRRFTPSAAQFGRSAWYCIEIERALKRFDSLVAEAEAAAEPEMDGERELCEALAK